MKIEEIKNYLARRIARWYANANIDYGVRGEGLKEVFVEDTHFLVIVHEEEGKLYRTCLPYYEDFTPTQIYDIWMEASTSSHGVQWEPIF